MEQPLSNDTYEELSPLLRRINQQHLQINAQMQKLQRKTDEFIQITSHMQEGLVVLDKQTHIRSINSTAMRVFNTEEACVGSSFFQVNLVEDIIRLSQLDEGVELPAEQVDIPA